MRILDAEFEIANNEAYVGFLCKPQSQKILFVIKFNDKSIYPVFSRGKLGFEISGAGNIGVVIEKFKGSIKSNQIMIDRYPAMVIRSDGSTVN
jgi:hypothetical protein